MYAWYLYTFSQDASDLLSLSLSLLQSACSWALGQIGRHTPEHAKAVAQANVLPKLLEIYLNQKASEDLQTKVPVCASPPHNLYAPIIIIFQL